MVFLNSQVIIEPQLWLHDESCLSQQKGNNLRGYTRQFRTISKGHNTKKVYPIYGLTTSKTLRYQAAHTYVAYIKQYPPFQELTSWCCGNVTFNDDWKSDWKSDSSASSIVTNISETDISDTSIGDVNLNVSSSDDNSDDPVYHIAFQSYGGLSCHTNENQTHLMKAEAKMDMCLVIWSLSQRMRRILMQFLSKSITAMDSTTLAIFQRRLHHLFIPS